MSDSIRSLFGRMFGIGAGPDGSNHLFLNQRVAVTDPTRTVTASTANTLEPHGFYAIDSASAQAFTLGTPAGGEELHIVNLQTTTDKTVTVESTTTTFEGTSQTVLTFNAAGEAIILRGVSATRWAVIANTGAVGLS